MKKRESFEGGREKEKRRIPEKEITSPESQLEYSRDPATWEELMEKIRRKLGAYEKGGEADLHIHTLASDGIWTPEKTVDLARELDLSAIGITDHDRIDVKGIERAQDHGRGKGVVALPGIELSVRYGPDTLHVLGYFFDEKYKSPEFQKAIKEEVQKARERRNEEFLAKINSLFGPGSADQRFTQTLTMKEVIEIAGGKQFQRPHIYEALERRGIIGRDKQREIAGRGSPAYVPTGISFERAKTLFGKSNAFISLAHPAHEHHSKEFNELIRKSFSDFPELYGMMGVEVLHPKQKVEDAVYYEKKADELGLVTTGGSDAHDKERPMGVLRIPDVVIDKMKERLGIK